VILREANLFKTVRCVYNTQEKGINVQGEANMQPAESTACCMELAEKHNKQETKQTN